MHRLACPVVERGERRSPVNRADAADSTMSRVRSVRATEEPTTKFAPVGGVQPATDRARATTTRAAPQAWLGIRLAHPEHGFPASTSDLMDCRSAAPELLDNWSRTRLTSGDGKQRRRLAAVRRLGGVRDSRLPRAGRVVLVDGLPARASLRRSSTERHVTVDLVAIAVRGDGHCRWVQSSLARGSVGGVPKCRHHGAPSSTAAATSARARASMSSARSSIDWRCSADISPSGAGMSPAIRRGDSRQSRGGEAAACSIRYRRTAAMSSASSSACCPTIGEPASQARGGRPPPCEGTP